MLRIIYSPALYKNRYNLGVELLLLVIWYLKASQPVQLYHGDTVVS